MDLMKLLQDQVSDSLMDQLAGQLGGGAPKEKTSTAVSGAMNLLMGALANNASTPQGASSLLSALDRDHDGSILDDVAGFLGGSKQANNANMLNGAGILKHVLGQKQQPAVEMLSKETGMDASQVMGLMVKLAPMVMGMLGKVKKEQNLDQGGLSDFLKTSQQVQKASSSGAGDLFTRLLDKDGDGSIMDDVAQSGIKALFGKLFKR
jgi:hypothetical protein